MRLAARAREQTGLSQREFARLIGVRSQSTVARWETTNSRTHIAPTGPARALLVLIEAHPDLCTEVLRNLPEARDD